MNPYTGHLTTSDNFAGNIYREIPESHLFDALKLLDGKKETYVDLTQTNKNKLAFLCEKWRKEGFSKSRIEKHKKEWIRQHEGKSK